MVYDVFITDCDNLFDAYPMETNLIRLNDMSPEEMDTLARILAKYKVSVWLSPHEE